MNTYLEIKRLRAALEHIARGKARDGGPADAAEYAQSALDAKPLATRAEVFEQQECAENWLALKSVARIRLLGVAGIDEPMEHAHIGLELWTHHPASTELRAMDAFERFVARARVFREQAFQLALAQAGAEPWGSYSVDEHMDTLADLTAESMTAHSQQPHEHVWEQEEGGDAAVCACGERAHRWYCPNSPDHLCHYSRSED